MNRFALFYPEESVVGILKMLMLYLATNTSSTDSMSGTAIIEFSFVVDIVIILSLSAPETFLYF